MSPRNRACREKVCNLSPCGKRLHRSLPTPPTAPSNAGEKIKGLDATIEDCSLVRTKGSSGARRPRSAPDPRTSSKGHSAVISRRSVSPASNDACGIAVPARGLPPISVLTQSTGSRPKTEHPSAATAAKVYIFIFMPISRRSRRASSRAPPSSCPARPPPRRPRVRRDGPAES